MSICSTEDAFVSEHSELHDVDYTDTSNVQGTAGLKQGKIYFLIFNRMWIISWFYQAEYTRPLCLNTLQCVPVSFIVRRII
jgi:hypothetical protein